MHKYLALKEQLARHILNERHGDARLPSLRKLAKTYHVSLLTAQRAVKALADDGMVNQRATTRAAIVAPAHEDSGMPPAPAGNRKRRMMAHDQIVFLNFFSPVYNLAHHNAWRAVIDDFEARHPWISIRWTPTPAGAATANVLRTFDVFYMTPNNLADFMARNIIRNLTTAVESDPMFDRNSFTPMAQRAVTVKNAWCGIPHYINVPLLFYRKTIIARAGADGAAAMKSGGWTWPVLIEIARAMHNAKQPGAIVSPTPCYQSLHRDFARAIADGNTQYLELLTEVLRLTRGHDADLLPVHHTGAQSPWNRFMAGQAGFTMDYSYKLPYLAGNADDSIGITGLPLMPHGCLHFTGALHAMGAACENPEAAWLFLRHLAGPDVFNRLCAPMGRVPVHKACRPRGATTATPDISNLITAMEKDAVPTPYPSRINQPVNFLIFTALREIFKEQSVQRAEYAGLREKLRDLLDTFARVTSA